MSTEPLLRTSPDACPGALRVHEAADGGLVRVRVPGGSLTGAQLEALCEAATELGDGSIFLTSRANVQIRGLGAGAEAALAPRLARAGLLPSATHERVRNIVASPLSGCDRAGFLDVHPLVAELDRALCADPRLARLPGRFLFVVDDGRADVAGLRGDVGFVATGPAHFSLLLAGRGTGDRIAAHDAVRTAVACAIAFLDERDRQRSGAWRLGELPDGVPALVDRLGAMGLRGAGAGRGQASTDVPSLSVPPPPGPGPIGLVAGPDGSRALVVAAPLGCLGPRQVASLLAVAGRAAGRVRLTPWRSLVVPSVPQAEAGSRLEELGRAGLITDASCGLVGVTACTGQPGCARGLADVRTAAERAALRGSEAVPEGSRQLPVHWVACEHRCGRPGGRAVEVLATRAGYEVSEGGVLRGRFREPGAAWAAAEAARRA